MPYLSVIVPIYNVEQYLDECIKSILRQSYSDFELILVDDGSTDNSTKICDSYTSYQNVRVVHKSNGGISSARNAGIDASKGQWLVFIDSDDYINEDDFFSKIVEQTENADVVIYGCTQFLDVTYEVVRKKFEHIKHINTIVELEDKLETLNKENNVSIAAWMHACRLDYIKKYNILFDESMRICEELDWFTRLLLYRPNMRAIDNTSYYYRIRNGSLSRKKEKDAWEDAWEYRYKSIKKSIQCIEEITCAERLKVELFNYFDYQYILLIDEIMNINSIKEIFVVGRQTKDIKFLLRYGSSIINQTCSKLIRIFGFYLGGKMLHFCLKKYRYWNKK